MSRLDWVLPDVLETIERGIKPDAEVDAAEQNRRRVALRDVLERLPPHIRRTPRLELLARIKPQLVQAVTEWNWGGGSMTIYGPSRIGKSSSAGYVVRRLAAAGFHDGGLAFDRAMRIRWQSCRELSVAARETRLGQTPDEVIRCQRARLLILNDLSTTEHKETFERILDYRYEHELETIFTTGASPQSLLQAYGDAFCYRVIEYKGTRGKFIEYTKESV